MSYKSCSIFIVYSRHKNGHNLLDIQYFGFIYLTFSINESAVQCSTVQYKMYNIKLPVYQVENMNLINDNKMFTYLHNSDSSP